MSQTVFSQPSTVDVISKYLSPVPTDLINAGSILPSMNPLKNISLWDENVQILQGFPDLEKKPSNKSDWVESIKQGVKFLVEFNQRNRVVSLYVKSIEFPSICKKLNAGEIQFHQFDNQKGFMLNEIPPAFTESGKIERFLFGCYSFRHQGKNYRATIRVTDLNHLESFAIPEETPDDYATLNSIAHLKCNSKISFFIISDSGRFYSPTKRHFPTHIFHDEQPIKLTKPCVDLPSIVGFLDDRWLIWMSETVTRTTRSFYYAADLKTEEQSFIFGYSSIKGKHRFLIVGNSLVLIINQKGDKQKIFFRNVETKQKFKFASNTHNLGNIKDIYVVAPGVIKYNHSSSKSFVTCDVSKEKLELIVDKDK